MAKTILIVEDEPAIRELIGFTLGRAGYEYDEADSAKQAQAIINAELPVLVLLDLMLPGQSGIDFARQLKKTHYTRSLPIIMLTALGEQTDKVRGLELGADDYITKPFSPSELLARIKAVLRRTSPQATNDVIETNGLRLDPAELSVHVNGERLLMGPTEVRLLHFFMTHSGRIYTRAQLLDMVWGNNVYIEERTVDVHIRRLRKAMEEQGIDQMIQTVRGMGYRFAVC